MDIFRTLFCLPQVPYLTEFFEDPMKQCILFQITSAYFRGLAHQCWLLLLMILQQILHQIIVMLDDSKALKLRFGYFLRGTEKYLLVIGYESSV